MNKLIFGDIEMSKKGFYEGKKAVNLSVIDVNKIVVSNKIKGMKQVKFLLFIWMVLVVCVQLYVLFYHK